MKTLKVRLAPQQDEVLKFTARYGRTRAMEKFGVHDYVCFHKWLLEVTGGESFGLRPAIGWNGYQTLGEQLVDAFLQKVAKLQTENAELKDAVNILKRQVSIDKSVDEDLALTAMEVCQA